MSMKKRFLSTMMALTVLGSMFTGAYAEPVNKYHNDFDTEANMWTASGGNTTRTLVADEDNSYLSITGSYTNQHVLVQIANVSMQNTNGNYTMYQFRTKISENQDAIRFYREYTADGASKSETIVAYIDRSLRGITDDVDWIDIKIVLDENGYLIYINDVPQGYKTLSRTLGEYKDTRYRFLAGKSVADPETSTVYLDNLYVYDVAKTELFKFEMNGEDKVRIPGINEETATTSEYSVTAVDYMNNQANDITWSLDNEYQGVSIDNNGVLTVDNTAVSGEINVVVSANLNVLIKKVRLITETVKAISVTGDDIIPLKNKYEVGTITRQYTCEAVDYSDQAVEADVTWNVETDLQGVEIDENGVVTISDDTEAGTFDVVATIGEKSGRFTVAIVDAEFGFQNENVIIHDDFQDATVGANAYNYKVLLWDNSTKTVDGYVSPFEVIEEENDNIAVKMTTPALTQMGTYKVHYAQFQTDTKAINDDLFILSLKYKFESLGADTLRFEIKALQDSSQITYNLSSAFNTNLNYKHSIGKWNEVKFVFNRKDHSYRVYNANALQTTGTANDAFWTNGIDYLRVIHCTNESNKIPTDGLEHSVYIDDYKVYSPKGVTLEGIYATGIDAINERNILNLETGFANYTEGSSPKLSNKILTIHLSHLNTSENAVKVSAIAALYNGDKLVSLSDIGEFTVMGGTMAEDNAVDIVMPQLEEDETFWGYTLKLLSWYGEDMTPFDYSFNMTNDRWNFAN